MHSLIEYLKHNLISKKVNKTLVKSDSECKSIIILWGIKKIVADELI